MQKKTVKYNIVLGWHYYKQVKDLEKGDIVIQTINRGMGQIDGKIQDITIISNNKRKILLTNKHSVYFSRMYTIRSPETYIPCRSNMPNSK